MASRSSFTPPSRTRSPFRTSSRTASGSPGLRRPTESPDVLPPFKRPSWAEGLLLVCSHRLRRAAPRSLRQVAVLLLGPLAIAIYLLLFSDGYERLLTWSAPRSLAGPEDLRIVVFGSQDTWGSAPNAARSKTTWPEHLCELLKCSSLVSLVPPSESHPGLIYNAAYNDSLRVIQERNRFANITAVPASDHFYVVEHYPVPPTPDLPAQVEQFLSMQPTGGDVPRATLWIFSFGAWDVWNLAALPREMSEPIVDTSVAVLFEQIELLYRKSLKPGTIAWSDFWSHVHTEKDLEYLTHPPEGSDLDPTRVEGFRVLIPELFDMTLTPGWKNRAPPSTPYTRSMEMRNAVSLTKRWNELVSNRLEDWRRKKNDKPDRIEEEGIAMVDGASPSSVARRSQDKPKVDGKGRRIIYAPYPFRLGLHATVVSSLVSVMTEQDLQQAGLRDGRGRGTRSRTDPMRFLDVRTPCVHGGGSDDVLLGKYTSAAECKRPNDHLFYDDFTLGQRGSKLVARKAAEYLHDQQVI